MKSMLLMVLLALFAGCSVKHNPRVRFTTELGDFEAVIFTDKAPLTAGNFMAYVDSGRYNSHACLYRVVRLDNQPGKKSKIEVVQGGFYEDSLIEKYQFCPIRHETTKESGVLHKDGVLSMARIEPGTASSEFFICVGDQPELDFGGKRNPDGQGFAAFGKVTSGMEIVRKIQLMKDTGQYLLRPVIIKSVRRIKD
jgi:peptidyl-prolyl cis-trans isomerase A (cyclophilin A)